MRYLAGSVTSFLKEFSWDAYRALTIAWFRKRMQTTPTHIRVDGGDPEASDFANDALYDGLAMGEAGAPATMRVAMCPWTTPRVRAASGPGAGPAGYLSILPRWVDPRRLRRLFARLRRHADR